uniref:Ion_trans_2 domain-containing protein n=1 Tax=Wuchereria bancrofti TaxID=6293 RepID=A0A1I8EDX3_WUCBA
MQGVLDMEEGNLEPNHRLLNNNPISETTEIIEDEKIESRTIPVWLALLICIGWICICAGLFCLWETRWSYFTSLYFFFISLSTIGLGDVVPDHPHMLILMFWLVIIGLSIVSMLLGKEYQRALACGDPVKRNEILQRLMAKEPWYIRNMAPHLLTEKQTAQLDKQAETYERSVRMLNNKNVQTEEKFFDKSSVHNSTAKLQDMGTAMSSTEEIYSEEKDVSAQWMKDTENAGMKSSIISSPLITDILTSAPNIDGDLNSISEVTSLPMDLTNSEVIDRSVQARVSLADQEQQIELCILNGCAVQTDIAQFQVDEIMLKLHDLQNKTRPKLMDRSMETSLDEGPVNMPVIREENYELIKNMEHDKTPIRLDVSTDTESLHPEMVEQSAVTEEESNQVFHRSMETDAWMSQIQTPECSRAVQTTFDDENRQESQLSAKRKKTIRSIGFGDSFLIENSINFINFMKIIHFLISLNDYSTQCSIEARDTCDTFVQTMLDMNNFNSDNSIDKECNASKASLSGRMNDANDCTPKLIKPKRRDLTIQTDDSYLKIARRLDQIRTNRTESLHICMAKPLKKRESGSSSKQRIEKSDERRAYQQESSKNRRKESKQTNKEQILQSIKSVPETISAKTLQDQNDGTDRTDQSMTSNFSTAKNDVS